MIFAAAVVGILVTLHLVSRLIVYLSRDNHYNSNISFGGGRSVGEDKSGGDRLVQDNSQTPTLVKGIPREHVTSSFMSVCVRLCKVETGECHDAILEDRLVVGRRTYTETPADILLDDPAVSRRHCLLYRRGEQILIQDLDSANHTFVNGFIVEGAVPLSQGDKVHMGNGVYRFSCWYVEEA